MDAERRNWIPTSRPAPDIWFGEGTFTFCTVVPHTLETYNCGGPSGVRTIPIDPPLTVPANTWVVIEWHEGDETASARILGPEEPAPNGT